MPDCEHAMNDLLLACDLCSGTEWSDYAPDRVMCQRCGNVQRAPVEVRNARDEAAVMAGVARAVEEGEA